MGTILSPFTFTHYTSTPNLDIILWAHLYCHLFGNNGLWLHFNLYLFIFTTTGSNSGAVILGKSLLFHHKINQAKYDITLECKSSLFTESLE